MSRVILRQPDGQLSIFSTVTDSFIYVDGTPEEIATATADDFRQDVYERTLRDAERIQAGTYPRRQWVTYEEAVALDACYQEVAE